MIEVLTTQWSWRTAQGRVWIWMWSAAMLVSAPPPSPHPHQIRITLSLSVLTIPLDHQISRHLLLSVSSLYLWYIYGTITTFTDGSLPSTYNLASSFESCSSSVFCSSLLDEGGCVIRYGQDPSYQDLGPPIQGPLNSSFPLPLMEVTTTYYYQVTINSSLIIQLRGNLTTGECELGYDWCCHEVIISVLFHSWCSINHY